MGKECYPSALPGQWAAEAPPFSSPCPTCPHSFPKLSFQLSRAQCSLSPYLVAPSRATSPAPPSGWRGCGGPVLQGAVPPTPPLGFHWQRNGSGRKAVLRLASVTRPSGTRHGDHVRSPGRVPHSAPACHPPPAPGPAGIPRASPPPLSRHGTRLPPGWRLAGGLQEGTKKVGLKFGVRRTPPRLLCLAAKFFPRVRGSETAASPRPR